ncbi:hypothetical protein QBC47DRAFT_416493 [Echria macrotheca]|uniref:Rhodopsin domain-containing protein n=1 Tax=Echria macrotheca TaxID=438768 RepID=A0AAJ0B5E1_9PEZI|nr:hypothetical protein QBC47DRAFT_416493 [Echria macrotheca]
MTDNSTTTSSVDLNESRAPLLGAVAGLGAVLGVIAVALRFYTRVVIVGKVFHSDYCILAALVSVVAFTICNGIGIGYGFGRHGAAVTPEEITAQLKTTIGVIFFYHLSHLLIKSSILLQYIRICVLPVEKRICYVVLALVIAEGFTWIVVLFLTCIPFSAMWDPGLPGAKCIDNTAGFYACAATIISADVAILVIPPFLLRHSSIPWYQKLLLGMVLALGGAATIASIFRIRVIYMATKGTDPAWDAAPNGLLALIEVDLGLICSCVATLMPLFRRWHPGIWPRRLRHRGGNRLETVSDLNCVCSESKSTASEDRGGKTDVGDAVGSGTKLGPEQ